MAKESKFPYDLDLSSLDTGSITNILNDIEQHLPLMESEGGFKPVAAGKGIL
ncbi:MAG: hypothetical protein QGG54_04055 [Gammaproteobacteria bacterium]|jgi:hypothetical protein|nr:hypothetical protein [Gammaproteobacteria bacterium]